MPYRKFRAIKPEIRALGVDDGVFIPHSKGSALIIGAVFRGGYWLDGVLSTKVEVDGFDATDKIASMITNSSHYEQLRVILLNGVTFAGFNVIDIEELNTKTRLPIIAVTRNKPNLSNIHRALLNLTEPEKRWNAVLHAGKVIEVTTKNKKKVFIETRGILKEDACAILQLTSTRSSIPEPLRVAHLIASGIKPL